MLKFEKSDEFVNSRLVYTTNMKYIGCVMDGAFASDAWISGNPYATMTGRVEVIWFDDNLNADCDRSSLVRITSLAMLKEVLPKFNISEEARLWLDGSDEVQMQYFGIFRK